MIILNRGLRYRVLVGVIALVTLVVAMNTVLVSAAGSLYVDGDTVRKCNDLKPCYTTINAGVAAAAPGDTIYVFPGTYNESVNLSDMSPQGNLALVTVNATGTPTPGTVTVTPATKPAIYTDPVFSGDITLNGFVATSPDDETIALSVNSDINLTNLTTNNGAKNGIVVFQAGGDVTVTGCTANQNGDAGIGIYGVAGNVVVKDSQAHNNPLEGIIINNVGGSVQVTNCQANGNDGGDDSDGIEVWHAGKGVTISGCITNLNGDDGIDVDDSEGAVMILDVTASQNIDESGVDVQYVTGTLTISSVIALQNGDDGILAEEVSEDVKVSNCTTNNNGDDGVNITNVYGDVSVEDSIANQNNIGEDADGFDIVVIWGSVVIKDSSGDSNYDDGFWVWDVDGTVEFEGCSAANNGLDGFEIAETGDVTAKDCLASGSSEDGFDFDTRGKVTISQTTSKGNDEQDDADGFEIQAQGDISITQVTSMDNNDDGIFIWKGNPSDDITIRDSIILDNKEVGVELHWLENARTVSVNNSVICGHGDAGARMGVNMTVDAEGNWWGNLSGPAHPDNPGGSGDAVIDSKNGDAGTIDYDPWIDTITPSGPVEAVPAGLATTISFQFSGGSGTAFLGQGPGDPNAEPLFTISTDNGTLTSSTGSGPLVKERINQADGTLEVKLIPGTAGIATVTLDGPCSLDSSIQIEVSDVEVYFLYLPLILR